MSPDSHSYHVLGQNVTFGSALPLTNGIPVVSPHPISDISVKQVSLLMAWELFHH